jgi:SPP1 family phage portal protein
MFLIEQGTELTLPRVSSIIQSFETKEKVKMNKYFNYYQGKQDIMRKPMKDASKPCNRIVTNYCFNIVNNYAGYLTGVDITYSSNQDISAVQNILNYNDVSSEDSQLLKNALIFGVAYEINYVDEAGMQRFKVLDSRECIPVYYNNLNNDLACVIRYYKITTVDNEEKYYIEVYSAANTTIYESNITFSSFGMIEQIPNYYGQVPVTVFNLNDEWESIFDKIITLQDAYNTLLSSEVDDFEAFCDAYLVLKNLDADPEDIAAMKENRVLLIPADGGAEYLSKNISDTQIENMLSNINDTIHKIANSPDFSQESFGTSSGIALRFRLLGFENTAGAIEKNMTKALQKRIELICAILNLTGDAMWRDVQIGFTRNIPIDENATVNMVNSLRGLVSDKTLLAQIPFVQDVDAELEALNEQKEANAAMFGFDTNIPEEEEEE